ncbi:type IV secretory system conjugative DNA transfer family protein [Oligoflexia bacterium]|nr:type IV secretory system conjugative DNA transfer family protein [Oligoflexia bacterium]
MKTYLINIPQDITISAAAFEEVFIQLHETVRGEKIALELVASAQNIGLCFTAEQATCEVIAGQIYAIAPQCDVVEINDFAEDIDEDSQGVGIELGLQRKDLFPLKDYREFKGDSLSGLLSVLSKCRPGEDVYIQYVICPERDTGFHHFKLNLRKRFDRIRHMFRIKYWFKREAGKSVKGKIEEKTSERHFKANIRMAALSSDPDVDPEIRLEAVLGVMSNFNTLDYNQIKVRRLLQDTSELGDFAKRTLKRPFILSTKELATFFHLPSEKESPNLLHVLSVRQAPPRELPTDASDSEISFFGDTNFRDERIAFGIRRSDRRRHLYTVGKSGSGKSKLLELLIQNDIESGFGVGVLDPHGDLVDNILRFIPEHRVKDVIVFDPSDLAFPPSFNPLEQVSEELKMRVTIGFIEIFKKLFGTNWSPRLEHVLRYTTLALLDTPGTTVLSILKMLTDKKYRQMIVANIQDNVVKNFWVSEFAGWSEKFDSEAITPLINKVGQFVATNMIRNIVGQPINRFDFREIMDNQKILLMKVSKGILGEENASLLGAIAVTKIYQSAMSRADILEEDRIDFYFYVDEFHNFATESFDEILSEARKYRLNLTLANQFLGQLSSSIRETVFGNVGSLLSFRVGAEDAKLIAHEFKPRFNDRDILNLGIRDFCVKMTIDGEIREAFSGRTLDMIIPEDNFKDECIALSRENYAQPLVEVEEVLQRWEDGEFDAEATGTSSGPQEEVDFEEPLI